MHHSSKAIPLHGSILQKVNSTNDDLEGKSQNQIEANLSDACFDGMLFWGQNLGKGQLKRSNISALLRDHRGNLY